MVFTDPPPFSIPTQLCHPVRRPKPGFRDHKTQIWGSCLQRDIPYCMVLSCFLDHRNYFPIDFQPFPALCDGQVVPSQKPGYRMGSRVLRHFGDGFGSNLNIADVDFQKSSSDFPKYQQPTKICPLNSH